MNRSAAYEMFGEMRHSTLEEQQLYEKMLSKYSVPFESKNMRYTRNKVKNVRAYQIGCREPYPHWLRKAIACNNITIENNVGGLVDVCTFYWNGKKQYFYEGD